MTQFTIMSCFDSCGMLVPRVCDGSALGGRKADIDITDILSQEGQISKELAQTRLS